MSYKETNACPSVPKSMVLKRKRRVASLAITNAAPAPPELNAQAAIRVLTSSKALATQPAQMATSLILKMLSRHAKFAQTTSMTTSV